MNEKAYQDALAFNPSIVVIKLGTNESNSFNWKYKADFTKDLQKMVDAFKALPAQPKIYLCYPSMFKLNLFIILAFDGYLTSMSMPFISTG